MGIFDRLFGRRKKVKEVSKEMEEKEEKILIKPPRAEVLSGTFFFGEEATHVIEEKQPLKEMKPDEMVSWEEGQVIEGLYKVKGSSIGAMGIVYFVDHLKWKIPLAVKTPLPELVSQETAMKRFIREAETWVDLGMHPNIATCFYVRKIGGLPRIFIEYVDGGSLKDWIKEGRVKDWRTILDLAIQFCRGMEYAHNKGVIHRDVKPANCLMTKDGTLKITDFGLAKSIKIVDLKGSEIRELGVKEGSLTMIGVGLGTPEYMPPEQFDRAKEAGKEADIYSFGVMLYELVCGKRPFVVPDTVHPDERVVLYMKKHKEEIPQEPASLRLDCPKALNDLILKCLEKDPEIRRQKYSSFESIRKDLEALYQEILKEPYPREIPDEVKLKADGLNNKAVSYLDLDRKEEAIKCWKAALNEDPQHLFAIYNLAFLEWEEGKIDDLEFIEQIKSVISRDPVQAYYLIGLIHLERADLISALECLKKAVELSPEIHEFQNTLGLIYFGLGIYKEASLRFLKATEIAPGNWQYRINLTISLLREGQIKEVKKYLSYILDSYEGKLTLLSMLRLSSLPNIDEVISMLYNFSLPCFRVTKSFAGHKDSVLCVTFSPDSMFILSGSRDTTMRLWEVHTGKNIMTFRGHTRYVSDVSFSPDGKMIVSGSGDGTAKLWDTDTGRCIKTFFHDEGGISSVCFSSDGKFIITASWNGSIKVWELTEDEDTCICEFNPSYSEGPAHYLSPLDARTIISGHKEVIKIWDIILGECLGTMKGHFYKKGDDLLVASNEVSIYCNKLFFPYRRRGETSEYFSFLDLEKGHKIITIEQRENWINSICLSRDGKFCAVAREESVFHLWDVSTIIKQDKILTTPLTYLLSRPIAAKEYIESESKVKNLIEKVKGLVQSGKYSLAYETLSKAREIRGYEHNFDVLKMINDIGSQHGKRIGIKDMILLRGIEIEAKRTTGWLTFKIPIMKFSSDSTTLLLEFSEGNLGLWDIKSNKYLKIISFKKEGFAPVWIHPDLKLLLLKHGVEDIFIWWDVEKGESLNSFTIPPTYPEDLFISDDGKWLFTGHVNHLSKRNASSGEEVEQYNVGTTFRCYDISIGKEICVFGTEEGILILSLKTKERLLSVKKHGMFNYLQFSSCGNYLLANVGRDFYVFEIKKDYSGISAITMETGDKRKFKRLYYSPIGNFIIAVNSENSLQVWSFDYHNRTYRLLKEANRKGFVWSACFSSDGRFISLVTDSSESNGAGKYKIELWELIWEFEFLEP